LQLLEFGFEPGDPHLQVSVGFEFFDLLLEPDRTIYPLLFLLVEGLVVLFVLIVSVKEIRLLVEIEEFLVLIGLAVVVVALFPVLVAVLIGEVLVLRVVELFLRVILYQVIS
jgi:hypothetical protein